MKQGDIVIINFPFTSLENSKIRPALVISNDKFNKGLNVILLAIFGKDNEYSMPLAVDDLENGQLMKKSYVRFSNILSLEKRLIIKKIASLKNKALEKTKKRLIDFIN